MHVVLEYTVIIVVFVLLYVNAVVSHKCLDRCRDENITNTINDTKNINTASFVFTTVSVIIFGFMVYNLFRDASNVGELFSELGKKSSFLFLTVLVVFTITIVLSTITIFEGRYISTKCVKSMEFVPLPDEPTNEDYKRYTKQLVIDKEVSEDYVELNKSANALFGVMICIILGVVGYFIYTIHNMYYNNK